jgi:hypothetical protein
MGRPQDTRRQRLVEAINLVKGDFAKIRDHAPDELKDALLT